MTSAVFADNLGTFFVPSIADVEAIKVQAAKERSAVPLNDRDRFGLVLARLAVFHVFGLPEGSLDRMTDRTDCALELSRATGGKALSRVKVQPCRGAMMSIARRDLSTNDAAVMVHVPDDNRIARLVGWCWSMDVEVRGSRGSDVHYLVMAAADMRPLAELRKKAGLD